ncbi:MAG TPA: Gfo/Idh/MocA family oxidoreductase [Spirochaetia bacterium]|nr:Gfo/Idh/MocA family oxidoreductase [Spirochaetia bacterium]
MKKRLRTGIIGSGFAASFHFEAIQKIHEVDVDPIGVYSPTREHREAFARARGIKAFDSAEGLIEACDIVHVCVPVSMHEHIALAALERGIYPIVEKPITGFCGDGSESFRGDIYPKRKVLDAVHESLGRIIEAESRSQAHILYAENWVYAPAIQKEREIIEKSGAQILWMRGEEAHSGSHSSTYGYWKHSGGGVMLGKGCHPLTAALYLKRKEGIARGKGPIHPQSVTGRIHSLTSLPDFSDKGHIRKNYHDIDDFSIMHIEFQDGTLADIFASDIILGGIHNWLEVAANNHRTICNINPTNILQTYNPLEEYFRDIYVVEKTGTKQGWSNPSPEEDFLNGFPQEMEAFYRSAAYDEPLESDSSLAADAISTIFSAYLSAEQDGAKVDIRNY